LAKEYVVSFLDLVVTVLATLHILWVWFYGSIFAEPRTYWQVRGGLIGELLDCPLCLSVHVGWWVCVWYYLPALALTGTWLLVIRLPVIVMAVAGAGYICYASSKLFEDL
jgi:hypothetical protein